MKKRGLFLLAPLFAFHITFAQQPGWINYTTGGNVASLLWEDQWVWAGTQGGLVRIDRATGVQTFNNRANADLPENYITCMAIDQQGHKWIGTISSGIFEFDGKVIRAYNTENSPLPQDWIKAIAVDDSNRVWVGTFENGIAVLDGEDWTLYRATYPYASGLPNNWIRTITFDTSGAVWVGLGGGSGPVKFDGVNWVVYPFDNPAWAIAVSSQDHIWVFIETVGLGEFDGNSWTIYPAPDSLKTKNITEIAVDDSGKVWMATWGKGLLCFDGNTWRQFKTKNSTIPSDTLLSIAIDGDSQKWVGTLDNGVGKFDGVNFSTISASNSALPRERICALASDNRGNHWIGTDGGGLVRFDGMSWEIYTTTNSGLPDNNITALFVDVQDDLWIGTEEGGLVCLSGETWAVYDTLNSGLPENEITDISADTGGELWVTTPNWLVELDDPDWNQYTHPLIEQQMLWFSDLAIDFRGDVWVGLGYSGVSRFDGSNWIDYRSGNSPLPDDHIWDIAIDLQDHKWIATGGGLAEFDSTWVAYTTANSELPTNIIGALDVDRFNNKWVGTSGAGLARFDGAEWMLFGASQYPLPGPIIYALDIDLDNRVWIGAAQVSSGLAVYDEGPIQSAQPAINRHPDQLYLEHNYPNPFNPQTEIRYSLQQAGLVSLKVFDVVGREITTLVQEMQNAGSHSVPFSGAGLPSGVYFYQLRCGGEVQVKKMLLLK